MKTIQEIRSNTREVWHLFVLPDPCWEWQRASDAGGYGQVCFDGKMRRVHRVIYAGLVHPVSDDLDLHHICQNRICCNPSHLEPKDRKSHIHCGSSVISAQNAAKTHCPKGHPLSGDNLYINPRGSRECRICMAERRAAYKAKRASGQMGPVKHRVTHCPKGHLYDEKNSRTDPKAGARNCAICNNAASLDWHRRQKE